MTLCGWDAYYTEQFEAEEEGRQCFLWSIQQKCWIDYKRPSIPRSLQLERYDTDVKFHMDPRQTSDHFVEATERRVPSQLAVHSPGLCEA